MFRCFLNAASSAVVIAPLLFLPPTTAPAQTEDIGALTRDVERLYKAGDIAAATDAAKRALAIAEKQLGPDHPDIATALNYIAALYHAQGRYGEAEPLIKRSLTIRKTALGPDHRDVGRSLSNLAELYYLQGRYGEAERLYKRSLVILEKALGPDHADVGTVLNDLALNHNAMGRFAEAEKLYKRSLAITEKALGTDHSWVGIRLNNLALLYSAQGRYADAEPLYKRSLAIRKKALGPDHRDVGQSLSNLAGLYYLRGRYGDAEPLYRRALAIQEKALGPDHPDVGTTLNDLALMYVAMGRYAEAEKLYKRSIVITKKALGRDHSWVGIRLSNLASLYHAQARYGEAEPLLKRVVSIFEKALGQAHPKFGMALNNLAEFYRVQGRYDKAEPLLKRSVSIIEKAMGPEHRRVGMSLAVLGALYQVQGRYDEAEPLWKRSLAIFEKALGPDHPIVGNAVNNLATLYYEQGRHDEAAPLLKRCLAIFEKALGPDHPDLGVLVNNLAELYRVQGRHNEAEPLFKRALEIVEKALGPEHPKFAMGLQNLAGVYGAKGRYAEAQPLYMRSLAIFERALGPDHPGYGAVLNNVAGFRFLQEDWSGATQYLRRSTAVFARRTRRGTETIGKSLTGKKKSEAARLGFVFENFIKAAHRLAQQVGADGPGLAGESFEAAQWAVGSEAASSLAQMAARGAKGDAKLAGLVRERQDLVSQWQMKDKRLNAARSKRPKKRNAKAEKKLSDWLAVIDKRIAVIDKRLAKDFPDYAALASPAPLSIGDVRLQLAGNEALMLILDTPEWKPTPEETFLWVVTKTDSRWVRTNLGTKALKREVQALRCGLDRDGEWVRSLRGLKLSWSARNKRCAELWPQGLAAGAPLPFDTARAHRLYKELFGQVEDLIADKHLMIVPSGALTALPFQVLVTDPPAEAIPSEAAEYAGVAWLTRRHALTVLPSVASLKALRAHAKSSQATEPFIGFGNPLLTGHDGTDKRAWKRQHCATPVLASRKQSGALAARPSVSSLVSGGRAIVDDLRRLSPLPDTTDELCAVARASGVVPPDGAVHLGADATEAQVKKLSANGTLARARVVHFATHGLIAGETASLAKSRAEPSLLLTPPATASETDDGLLTASEVTTLKLDADWVILSACNTAAGGTIGGDALEGLARAFFYAGARALLVSHWYVNSQATVDLITSAFNAMKDNPQIGRAEALRRAMLTLIISGGQGAHPANWAPFVVVGEGGR